jgi:hypothetical protein
MLDSEIRLKESNSYLEGRLSFLGGLGGGEVMPCNLVPRS